MRKEKILKPFEVGKVVLKSRKETLLLKFIVEHYPHTLAKYIAKPV